MPCQHHHVKELTTHNTSELRVAQLAAAGFSNREIAQQLGVGKSAVTMRLERFRAKVKRELLRRLLAAQWE